MATEGPSTSSHNKNPRLSTIQPSVRTSSSRCTQCSKPNSKGARNIIVCIDGTSNQFGQKNTNVVKLFAKIDLETTDPEQYAYYSSGIGTRPKSLHILNRLERAVSDKFDMAIAWNMEEIVKDAYGWLARTYQEGDQIYLFGFSRGAYQVRVLAGMIHEVGLIRTPTEKQIGTAYDHYESIRSKKPKTRQIAREFKNTFSWKDLRVHFVGVWDTVSSVGLVRGDVFLSTSSSAAHACHFRHALALDELRVKFMPEYFHEMNSQVYDSKSKYSPANRRQESTVIDNISDFSEGKGHKTTEIKEVWFAGSHSDVGGRNRPGWSHQAGNVSLLWMRREAAAKGLVLQPTDIVWVPDDLDLGTSSSMSRTWRAIEYMPVKHQTSFSGGGEDTRRWHRLQPRRIIPGQKVHASILYANAYNPHATLGEGFDIPIIHAEPEDTELDNEIWENGLFDDTAAQELLNYLGGQQGIAPIYLDRLLFMLRFKEGKQCVRNVHDWRNRMKNLIERPKTSFVRLVALVAYYEAAYDTTKGAKSPAPPPREFEDHIFNDAKTCLTNILEKHKHRDGPRVVALLRPLTKHEILRERILTAEVLDRLVKLLDTILSHSGGNFGQAMDGLNCLLQCEHTRQTIVEKLKEPLQDSSYSGSRLSRILQINDSHRLIAALRMVLTLTRVPEATPAATAQKAEEAKARAEEATRAAELAEPAEAARAAEAVKAAEAIKAKAVEAAKADGDFWSAMKHRVRRLAEGNDRVVGRLAVEVLFALYDKRDQNHLNVRKANVRANVTSALISLKPKVYNPADRQGQDVDPEQQMLRGLFGFGADTLEPQHVKLIAGLQKAVEYGNARERTAGTLTLLKLCETEIIRTRLRETRLLNLFINQLQRKNSALLAAYALATCLRYRDMKDSESIKNNNLLPKHIVGMLRMDYFDDAVGPVEGFQVFRDIMQHADLREKIKSYNITEILNAKLGKGKPKETRTSLICLDIFLSFDPDGPWAEKLVAKSLDYLRSRVWKKQKAGVMILSALAQTKSGAKAISESLSDIIKMLLPEDYQPFKEGSNQASTNADQLIQEEPLASPASPNDHLPIQEQIPGSPASPDERLPISEQTPAAPVSPNEGQTPLTQTTTQSTDSLSTTSLDAPSEPSSWMMGPACALRILAQNEELRKRTHRAQEYSDLKNLHLTGTLVSETDTSPWRIRTPNRNDVTHMLDKMIKAIDEEISEEGLMSIGDAVLPHIKHWDRLVTLLRDRTVGVITILPALLGLSTLAILAVVLVPPIYLSGQAYGVFKRLLSQFENNRILDGLRGEQTGSGLHEGGAQDAPTVHDGGGPSSSGDHGNTPQGVEAT